MYWSPFTPALLREMGGQHVFVPRGQGSVQPNTSEAPNASFKRFFHFFYYARQFESLLVAVVSDQGDSEVLVHF